MLINVIEGENLHSIKNLRYGKWNLLFVHIHCIILHIFIQYLNINKTFKISELHAQIEQPMFSIKEFKDSEISGKIGTVSDNFIY